MAHRADIQRLRTFGSYITQKRIDLGMNAEDLAKKMKVGTSTVSRIENGEREIRLEVLFRLHKVLNIADDIATYLKTGKLPSTLPKDE